MQYDTSSPCVGLRDSLHSPLHADALFGSSDSATPPLLLSLRLHSSSSCSPSPLERTPLSATLKGSSFFPRLHHTVHPSVCFPLSDHLTQVRQTPNCCSFRLHQLRHSIWRLFYLLILRSLSHLGSSASSLSFSGCYKSLTSSPVAGDPLTLCTAATLQVPPLHSPSELRKP